MKLRISSSDKTVFLKDVTRFLPLWALYFLGGVVIMLSVTDGSYGNHIATTLNYCIGFFSFINLIYAALCAQLLFGDLFHARLCNALHALPLRRERWFSAHILAGLCFSLVPHLLGILILVPRLGDFWYTAFLWLLGMELEFLFFFGLAVLCVMLTGSRFAMVAVYALCNFFAYIAEWLIETLYESQLYGVVFSDIPYRLFCPTVALAGSSDYFIINMKTSFGGLGSSWGYLTVLAGIGIIFGVLALLLYRRRKLEAAGDFMAFHQCNPVFLLGYTLCFGASAALFSQIISGSQLVFLIVGLIVGWFTGLMLLRRTVKVFRLRSLLGAGLVAAVMLGSVLITRLDPLGLTRLKPAANDLQSVSFTVGGREVTWTDPELLQSVLDIHDQIIREGAPTRGDATVPVYIRYTLKDGTQMNRNYRAPQRYAIRESLAALLRTPEAVLGYDDWEAFLSGVDRVDISLMTDSGAAASAVQNPEKLRSLLEAIRLDCLQSDMLQSNHYLFGYDTRDQVAYLALSQNDRYSREIRIFKTSLNTVAWLEEYQKIDPATD